MSAIQNSSCPRGPKSQARQNASGNCNGLSILRKIFCVFYWRHRCGVEGTRGHLCMRALSGHAHLIKYFFIQKNIYPYFKKCSNLAIHQDLLFFCVDGFFFFAWRSIQSCDPPSCKLQGYQLRYKAPPRPCQLSQGPSASGEDSVPTWGVKLTLAPRFSSNWATLRFS